MVIKYRPRPSASPRETIVSSPSKIEQQIEAIYQEAPVVRTRPARGKPVKQYYEPTPEQAEKIIELAVQLPPEKQAKYIVVPTEPKSRRLTAPGEPFPSYPSYRGYGVTPITIISAKWQKIEPLAIREVRESVGEVGLTRTLMKGAEALQAAKPWSMEARYPYMRTPMGEAEKFWAREAGYVPAGFVGTFERYVRGDIPTPSTAVLEPIFDGGKLSEAQFLLEHPGYAFGGFIGEYAQAKYIWGPALQKAWSGLKRVPIVQKVPISIEKAKHSVVESIISKAPERIQKWYFGPYWKEWKVSQQLVWEKKPFVGYPEFYLTTETMLPTRPPAEAWFIKFRGTPTTPFAKTLEAAIAHGKGLGGLAATQQIIVTDYAKHVPFSFTQYPITESSMRVATQSLTASLFGVGFSAMLRRFAVPTKEVVTKPSVRPLEVSQTRAEQFLREHLLPVETQIVTPIQEVTPIQKLEAEQTQVLQTQQVQQTMQQQVQGLRQVQRQLYQRQQLTRMRVPEIFRPMRKRRKRERETPFGLFGRYKRQYPVMPPKKALKFLLDL